MGTSPTCCLRCWGQKKYYHLEIYSLSFKGSTVFLAFLNNSFWPVKSYETVILTCKKYTGIRQIKSSPQWAIIMPESKQKYRWSFKRKGEFQMIVFLPHHPRQHVANNKQCMFLYTHYFPGVTFVYLYYFYFSIAFCW